ncbi:ATP-dependent serine peptidase containing a PDZ domain protein [Cryobacterium adonitolivorans]|uniref:endopeptidase La n=1 Tax=Cryobacterium adonitolivorans TaxID=1259189 RepID=A0A4R8W306_9MICO|nr:S16 family serine protease [Cryobacterium adonitolivorans]TFB99773.1 ATP-dependent serine peptidase containing a PDZ domain protein [Cryobacterium adonitolivorans]
MALFTAEPHPGSDRPRRASRTGWVVLGIALVTGLTLAIVPSPYVVEKPGPVYNTLGSAKYEGKKTDLITIPDETVYPTEGTLDLLTVSVLGNPDNRLNWLTVASAWLDPSQAVVPIESVFPADVTTEQRDEQNQAAMVNSQQDAIAAALTNLGYDYPTELSVVSLADKAPAEGLIGAGDLIETVNGEAVADITALRAALTANGADAPATVGLRRDGAEQSVEVAPIDIDGNVVLGINVKSDYKFPFDVNIQLDKVGGPSAGMMFALGIIDKLTPDSIHGGADVAGTGTIDQSGTVGPIGGIRQKLFGAKNAGAEWFLAPAANCDEVSGHIPDGLTVLAVGTLDESLTALDAIRTGADTGDLPTCPGPDSTATSG